MTQSNEVANLIEIVNSLLFEGEPGNISEDTYNHYTGYKPQAVIDAMNQGFGIGQWGFKELSSEISGDEKATLAVSQVEVWLAGIDFRPSGWGQARVTKGDLGDARKGAQTDAIKKSLSYFSIGNRAYQGLLKVGNGKPQTVGNTLENSPASEQQLREIARLANGLSRKVTRPATYKAANELLNQLSREYNAREAKAS